MAETADLVRRESCVFSSLFRKFPPFSFANNDRLKDWLACWPRHFPGVMALLVWLTTPCLRVWFTRGYSHTPCSQHRLLVYSPHGPASVQSCGVKLRSGADIRDKNCNKLSKNLNYLCICFIYTDNPLPPPPSETSEMARERNVQSIRDVKKKQTPKADRVCVYLWFTAYNFLFH